MLKRVQWMLFSLFLAATAQAEEQSDESPQPEPVVSEDRLYMEINKLEQRDNLCVAYVRFSNQSGTEFSEFKAELFAFDQDDVITAHFLADFQQVLSNKTMVKLVPMKDTVCEQVSSILLNQMISCKSGDADVDGCLRMLETGAKGSIKLFK